MQRGHECHHCRQWIADGETHDCWSTTEAALTQNLHEDLQDAYDRLRAAAANLGPQRIYASHHSIMFTRRACYCFVRPKRAWLEVCLFLERDLQTPLVRRADRVSRGKVAHMFRVTHRDEVEAPLTDWLREAYEYAGAPAPAAPRNGGGATPWPSTTAPSRTRAAKKR